MDYINDMYSFNKSKVYDFDIYSYFNDYNEISQQQYNANRLKNKLNGEQKPTPTTIINNSNNINNINNITSVINKISINNHKEEKEDEQEYDDDEVEVGDEDEVEDYETSEESDDDDDDYELINDSSDDSNKDLDENNQIILKNKKQIKKNKKSLFKKPIDFGCYTNTNINTNINGKSNSNNVNSNNNNNISYVNNNSNNISYVNNNSNNNNNHFNNEKNKDNYISSYALSDTDVSIDGSDLIDNYVQEDSNATNRNLHSASPFKPIPVGSNNSIHSGNGASSAGSIHIQSQLHRYTSVVTKQMNWNDEFQTLLAMEDTELKFRKLSHLARDFVYAAKIYATIIINELCLPFEQKSLRPVDMGGFAGGLKYYCQGILFKFAMDSMLNEDCWMYGGPVPRDDYASKSASNELKGLISYYMAQVNGLHYPLIALIDYKGFRLIALSLLPINSDTIRYGSSDSGSIVHDSIVDLSQKMAEAGKRINLKPHLVGSVEEHSKVLPSPGDLEAHLGNDNRYYVIDFSRTFPPEALVKRDDVNKRSIFYNLLRPEFVAKWERPLCSDAFTGWQRLDAEKQEHNAEVEDATQHLLTVIIPQLSLKLDREYKGTSLFSANPVVPGEEPSNFDEIKTQFATKFLPIIQKRFEGITNIQTHAQQQVTAEINNTNLMESIESTSSMAIPELPVKKLTRSLNTVKNETPRYLLMIIEEMHRLGINLRHMGRLRSHSISNRLRDLLLLEMAARSIKCIIKEDMRLKMKEVHGLSEEPFKEVVITIFNKVLDFKSDIWTRIRQTISSKFYMAFSYRNPDSPDQQIEESQEETWMERINPKNLFERLQLLTGITLSPIAQYEFSRDPHMFQFVDSDIIEIYSNVKHMNIVDYAEGMALSMAAQNKKGRERLRLLKMATSKFQSSLKSNPENFDCICQLGRTLVVQADSITSVTGGFGKNQYIKTLEEAALKFKDAIQISPTYSPAYYELAHVYILIAQHFHSVPFKCQRYYKMAADEFEMALKYEHPEKQSDLFASVLDSARNLFDRGLEGWSTYIIGVTLICLGLERFNPKDASVKLLLGKSYIYRPFYDFEEEKERNNFYIEAATKFQQALLLSNSVKSEILEIGRDIWLRSKVGNRKLYYPATYIFRLLVRGKYFQDNKAYSMYLDSLFEIIRIDTSLENPFIIELKELLELLISIDNQYCKDKIDSAITNQQQELCDFLKVASISTVVMNRLREKSVGLKKVNLMMTSIGNQTLSSIAGVFQSMEDLNLSNCPLLTDDGISEFLTNHGKPLTTLNLSMTLISSKSITIISNFCQLIHSLDIQNCPMVTTENLRQLAQIPKLKKIDISKCKVTNEVVALLFAHNIQELSIRNENRISDEALVTFSCSQLRVLDLSSCSKISDQTFIQLPQCPQLESLILEACYNITDAAALNISQKMPSLRKISLKSCKFITDTGIINIVQRCSKIEDMKLSRCHSLSDVAVEAISTQLSGVLERIDLSMCPQLSVESLITLLQLCTKLTAINLSENPKVNNEIVSIISNQFPGVIHLRLDSCTKITDIDGTLELSTPSLQTLSIKKSQISHQSFLNITASLLNLTSLSVKSCLQLTDLSFSSIGFLTQLEYLDISDNYRLLDNSMQSICKSLHRLKHLDISQCLRLSTKAFFMIGKHLTKLEELLMVGCASLNDTAVLYFAENLFMLRHIDISACTLITDKSIYALAHNQLYLEKLFLRDCMNITQSAIDFVRDKCNLFRLTRLSLHSLPLMGELKMYPNELILKPIKYSESSGNEWRQKSQKQNEKAIENKIKQQLRAQKALEMEQQHLQQEQQQKEQQELEKKKRLLELQKQREAMKPKYEPFTSVREYKTLVKGDRKGLDPQNLEKYLSPQEFEAVFGMNQEQYEKLSKWKKDDKKKLLHLF
ncbi:leucine-rich repeat-containing protein [Heterostelium album PN500]|uniref:Leucine-rich repeat-containing protein n=1 Tax=Heterostelium pallidum (strain ATCC 26659 / Pp 5 / PN500) TaxID=670386 RepID=D3BDW4_HETP5|nr:leucine-rich repeat-containing protein [Heterostelium album PN500]EFA80095.1 leucine-rich repeat-containing protein [Heterostelium album PN500]|eukprot:XP_020432215.1 leucine-rich repeat-containing protein [Heterostelium album PN500]